MKKVLLSAIAVMAFGISNAQEETATYGFNQGDIIIEGNLGFNSTDDKNFEEKESGFNFSPSVGYFVSDKFAVGLALSVGNSKVEEYNVLIQETTKVNAFAVGVFGRYYFLELGERFKTYAQVGLEYGSAKSEFTDGIANTSVTSPSTNGLGFGAGLGMNYFITPNMAINFGLSDILSYTSVKVDAPGAKATSNFNANVNVFNNFFATAQFGMTFKL